MNTVWVVLFFVVMAGLWWVAYKIEPHYSSKDGKRFLCNAQEIVEGKPVGRARETRVLVLEDGILHCSQKRAMRRSGSLWALIGKSPTPPNRLEVFVAQEVVDGHALPNQLALRLPGRSRVVPVLDGLLADRELRKSQSTRGTSAPAVRPDPD